MLKELTAVQHSLRQSWSRLLPYAYRVFDPADAAASAAVKRQTRLLNSLLVPLCILVIILLLLNSDQFQHVLFFSAILLVLLVIYAINRSGHYVVAATALSTIISLTVFVTLAVHPAQTPEIILMWTTPGILIAYLLLPLRHMILVLIANVIGILLLPALSSIAVADVVPVFLLTTVSASLMLIAATSRTRQLQQIEQQARAISESEMRYRTLLEASFELLMIHKDGLILDINSAVEALLGYQPDEVIGKSALDFIDPRSHRIVMENYQHDQREPYEALLRRKDGSLVHAELRGKAQWYQGQSVQVVAIHDVTERKMQEELAIEREKVKVLQKFIADLSHDLRTPLSVINTSIYLINRLAQDPARQHHQIEVLHAQAEHMQRLLQDLISMARLDKADTSDFKFRWVNVNDSVTEAIRDHRNLALRKKQNLTYTLAPDLPDVLIDPDEFKLAVKHLILNGLSYTPENGTVEVETAADAEYVIVRVRDNGVGIQALDLPYIFDHFYRADQARGEEGGTGVGLTIAKKIVEAHRGRIEASSDPGRGSVFSILIPIPPR